MSNRSLVIAAFAVALGGCATATPPPTVAPIAPVANEVASPTSPTLKRKIAIGRVSNETNYGRSLLYDNSNDPLGKQVSDMLAAKLVESQHFLVFERPDIDKIQAEQALTNQDNQLVGVDTLILGSLTEFGRRTTGERGFLSSTKAQTAYAKVELRLVDVKTGHVFFSTSGSAEATLESESVMGFGSRAEYDATLNDKAINAALSEVMSGLVGKLMDRPWETYILDIQDDAVFISGGTSQGINPGQELVVKTQGKAVKSPQTGFVISLPGTEIARIRVASTFGDNETNEGSVATVLSGSIEGQDIAKLIITAE
ncbi:CsgG/HfaB family protein [Ferrimonas balearica]|uniref:CsgG/HfaB family protein n=1 Tax=Ferrimonas balearica TaxID=44012 RepID=UPI001C9A1CF8|nr:CsgG/HfaB family protein [Ferrimonas balearica]MBY5923330.1 CsgG/HfaB family protein [Ferrimonas balearica]MBY5995288.1 CsgG/HfaB family protein [Ferrimonas balearica]